MDRITVYTDGSALDNGSSFVCTIKSALLQRIMQTEMKKPKGCIYPDCLDCPFDDCRYDGLEPEDFAESNRQGMKKVKKRKRGIKDTMRGIKRKFWQKGGNKAGGSRTGRIYRNPAEGNSIRECERSLCKTGIYDKP